MTDTALTAENTPSTGAEAPATTPVAAPVAAAPVVAPVVTDAPAAPADAAKAADAPADKPAPVVPEKYELKAPEGQTLNSDVMTKFEEAAREAGMSNEAAQKLVDKMAPQMQAAQQAQFDALRTQWQTESKSDKEFGGDKFDANMAVAKKALDAFGTPALTNLLNESGLGNHPEIIRAFFKAGQKISAGSFVPAGNNGNAAPTDYAKALYPTMN